MNPGFQLFDVVTVVLEGPLGDDPSAVERRIDIVDRHPEHLDPVFHRLFDGMRSAERRQQRGMDIDDPSSVSLQQHVADDAHIPRQTNQFHARGIEQPHDFTFVIGLRSVLLRREDKRFDTVRGGAFDNPRSGFVADHEHHLAPGHALLAGRDDGFEIGAAAAGEDCEASHGLSGLRHLRRRLHVLSPRPFRPARSGCRWPCPPPMHRGR